MHGRRWDGSDGKESPCSIMPDAYAKGDKKVYLRLRCDASKIEGMFISAIKSMGGPAHPSHKEQIGKIRRPHLAVMCGGGGRARAREM